MGHSAPTRRAEGPWRWGPRSGGLPPVDLERAPILVFWETTRACLLACRHCRADAIERPLPGELSTQEGMALVRQVAGFGERPPVLILTGGDVLMRPDAPELVAYARSLDVPVGLAPSVTPLLTGDILERLRDLGVRSVSISLDGARSVTHEGVRGVPGHFSRTLDALRLLVGLGFSVQVNTAVMRDNVEELGDLAAVLVDLGVPIWEVFFLVKVGRGTGVEELTPGENEEVAHFLFDASRYGLVVRTVEGPFFRRVAAWRREAGPDGDPIVRFSLGPLYGRLTAALRDRLGEPGTTPRAQTVGTRDGKGVIFVSCLGDVYPSGFLPLPLGNVREQSLVDVYRDHLLLGRIRRAEFGGKCGRCPFRDLCGGSRARAYAAFGDPLGEDPACAYVPSTGPSVQG